MTMHPRKNLLALCVVLVALTASVVAGSLYSQAPNAPQKIESAPAPYQFLLQANSGRLEVFYLRQGASWEKIAGYDVTLDDMPEADRDYLAVGLAIRDAAELQRALEDYLPNS